MLNYLKNVISYYFKAMSVPPSDESASIMSGDTEVTPEEQQQDSDDFESELELAPDPSGILAFRTSTILLGMAVKRHKAPCEKPKLSGQDIRELRLTDAFSHLAVAKSEVMAVSAYRKSTAKGLDLTACSAAKGSQAGPEAEPESQQWWCTDYLKTIFLLKNWARNEKQVVMKNHKPYPTVTLPIAPDLNGMELEEYLKNLRTKWQELPLPTHLWILERILPSLKDAGPAPFETVVLYSISVCHQKINRRFEHPWSKLISKSLEGAKMDNSLKIWAPDEPSVTRCSTDVEFLETLLNIGKRFPEFGLETRCPKLLSIARNLPPETEPLIVYTVHTRQEFHDFLTLLLGKYRRMLAALQKHVLPTSTGTYFEVLVSSIYIVGYSLWKMASCRSFEIHLRTIESLLQRPRGSSSTVSVSLSTDSVSSSTDSVEPDPTFTDLEANLTPACNDFGNLWKIYSDWLMLMLVHFEAAYTLRRFFRGPHYDGKPITIKIILSPPVSRNHLSLEDYLNSEHFPADAKTRADIIEWVDKAILSRKLSDLAKHAVKAWEKAAQVEDYDHAKTYSKQLYSLLASLRQADPEHTEDYKDILEYVTEWPLRFPKPIVVPGVNPQHKQPQSQQPRKYAAVDKDTLADTITHKLSEKADSLHEARHSYGEVANFGDLHFNGTLHCESCLASLLDPSTRESLSGNSDFKKILELTKDFGHLIGVSKRSCPCCQYFLSLLSPEDRFSTRDCHGNITACTLPPWTAKAHVDSMNYHFGSLLRDELLAQMAAAKLARKSSFESQDSQALSSGSRHSDDEQDRSTFSTTGGILVYTRDKNPFAMEW